MEPDLDAIRRGHIRGGHQKMKRVELLVHEYTKTVSIFHFFHSNKHHMSKKEMIHPTHFLVPTVLSTPRTKTKGLNFFGSIKIGMGAKTIKVSCFSVSIPDVFLYSKLFSRGAFCRFQGFV